ncbi:hypothetical protein ACFVTY_16695 [Streptomyces sp. NPDC058067]|uniref:hypothetical protein n=1 Tax=Streptomyces sp. NPDC058067 TaxID=3346324 RepID=UPI0036EB0F2B
MNAKTGRGVRRVVVAVAGAVGVVGIGAGVASAAEPVPVPPADQSVVMPNEQPPGAGFVAQDWYLPGVYTFGNHEPLGDGQ